jgi:hypothetical protein
VGHDGLCGLEHAAKGQAHLWCCQGVCALLHVTQEGQLLVGYSWGVLLCGSNGNSREGVRAGGRK